MLGRKKKERERCFFNMMLRKLVILWPVVLLFIRKHVDALHTSFRKSRGGRKMRGEKKLITLFPTRINGQILVVLFKDKVSRKAGEERAAPKGPILADASFLAPAAPSLYMFLVGRITVKKKEHYKWPGREHHGEEGREWTTQSTSFFFWLSAWTSQQLYNAFLLFNKKPLRRQARNVVSDSARQFMTRRFILSLSVNQSREIRSSEIVPKGSLLNHSIPISCIHKCPIYSIVASLSLPVPYLFMFMVSVQWSTKIPQPQCLKVILIGRGKT